MIYATNVHVSGDVSIFVLSIYIYAPFTHRLRTVFWGTRDSFDEHRLLSVCVPMHVWWDVREMSAESSFNRWLPVETWLNVQRGHQGADIGQPGTATKNAGEPTQS